MRRVLVMLGAIALLLPANAFARGDFDPTDEFVQNDWIPIHLGPLDLSITKAVAYLMIASVATILFGIFFMRTKIGSKPGRKETVGEMVYEIAQTQVAEQGLPSKQTAPARAQASEGIDDPARDRL
jgi:F-type H+-transporting ATPase subunit a